MRLLSSLQVCPHCSQYIRPIKFRLILAGTTGLPKGVLSTQRQFLTNVLNVLPALFLSVYMLIILPQVLVGGFRAALRRGDDFPAVQSSGPQKATLVAVPLFHVTGSTSFSVGAYFMKPEFPLFMPLTYN